MPEDRWPVRVGVNVMRARLTIIGFNIAIVSFQIAMLNRVPGGVRVPGLEHRVHVEADIALFIALALSLVAMIAYIMSSAFDEVGYCTHWMLVAGDLLMYLALAHTVAGFFGPAIAELEIYAAKLQSHAWEWSIIHAAMIVVGGTVWFLATYAGPVVSLLRSPFHSRTNIALGVAYLATLLALAWVNAQAFRVATLAAAGEPGLIVSVLRELVQPLRW